MRLNDPAAAEDYVTDVENGALSGRDGALRIVEDNARAIRIFCWLDGCLRGSMAIANFHFRADRAFQSRDANPIYIAHFAR